MKLNWALDKEHAEKPDILNNEMVWFDILDFFNYVQPPWRLDSDNLSSRNKRKIAAAKKHFENNGWMDPCYIMGIVQDVYPKNPSDERLIIENRHRLLAALQLGETHAPVCVPDHLVEELKSSIKFMIS